MMPRGALVLSAAILSACGPELVANEVRGSVQGVRFSHPDAAFSSTTYNLGCFGRSEKRFVTLSDTPVCANHAFAGMFLADGVAVGGQRMPALILVEGGGAFLDTGKGDERLTATSAKLTFLSDSNDTASRGHFTATFDGEALEGSFNAAHCQDMQPGCSAAGGALPIAAMLLLLRARRRERRA